MNVEIKVAQNFVLNFLYNKLPRRRVNLFGEELELALVDKFQDHWYPDKPFKGSAFRCLRITDPNDPVLNRAARESGNPLSDIVENLPADLAIWIDPGEVSYRIGEKGSVKILYSESDHGSGWNGVQVGGPAPGAHAGGASPGISPGAGGGGGGVGNNGVVGGGVNVRSLHNSSSTSSGNSDDLNAEVAAYLPMDNLNSTLGALSINCPAHPSGGNGPSGGLTNGTNGVGNGPSTLLTHVNSNGPNGGPVPPPPPPMGNGFSPFQPRPNQQPMQYTAGTFAQTKFGSTKLKTNSKKTNRMSPTEFSNYIKQRALQKQNSVGANANGINGHFGGGGNGGGRSPGNGGGGGFRPMPQSNNMMNGFGGGGGNFHGGNGGGMMGPNHHNMSNGHGGGNNMNFNNTNCGSQQRNIVNGGGSGGGSAGCNNDPFFFPLFPDRSGGGGGSNNMMGNFGNNSSSSSASNGLSSPSSAFQALNSFGNNTQQQQQQRSPNCNPNPWSLAETDTESFLQDILTVGLQQTAKQNAARFQQGGSMSSSSGNSSDFASSSSSSNSSDFGSSGLAGGLFADRFMGGSGGGLGNLGGGNGQNSDDSPSFLLGKGLLGGSGGIGGLIGNNGGAPGLNCDGSGGMGAMSPPGSVGRAGSMGPQGADGGGSDAGGGGGDKYNSQRVLVAN